MKLIKNLMRLVVLPALIISLGQVTGNAMEASQDENVNILFTHDLHGNFLPYNQGMEASLGGYARLKAIIDHEKALRPNSLLIDGGDFSMGTTYSSVYPGIASEIRMLGALGYEATTLGNHEFDFKDAGFVQMAQSAVNSGDPLSPILQANYEITNSDKTGRAMKDTFTSLNVKPYLILEKNGAKIGIFGLMGKQASSLTATSDLSFSDPVAAAKKIVAELKGQVDLIVCLSHSGTVANPKKSEDVQLAKKVPEIDVIVSAHSHTTTDMPVVVGDTAIVSCGDGGRMLGRLQLKRQGSRWSVAQYALIPVDDAQGQDEQIQAKIQLFQSSVDKLYFNQYGLNAGDTIGTLPFSWADPAATFDNSYEQPVINLLTDSYLWAAKQWDAANTPPADVSLTFSTPILRNLYKGPITPENIFSVCSLGIGPDGAAGSPLISAYLTGAELKLMCELDASIPSIMEKIRFCMSGVRYSYNPNRMLFDKVTDVHLDDGSEIENDRLYRMILTLEASKIFGMISENTFGLYSIPLRDQSGVPITNFTDHILYANMNQKPVELKEWYATASYVQSLGTIPRQYESVKPRKIAEESKSLTALLKHPSNFAVAVYIAGSLLLMLILLLLVGLYLKRFRTAKTAK